MDNSEQNNIYQLPIETADGSSTTLQPWSGKILLIVNVASRCGFSNQYHQLENLQQKFSNQKFSVLAFPCNQFLNQEPGDIFSIKKSCEIKYKITFPIFAKIKVNGANTSPLYKYLKRNVIKKPLLSLIPWNFTKFLVSADGRVIKRYLPTTRISTIEKDIENLSVANSS